MSRFVLLTLSQPYGRHGLLFAFRLIRKEAQGEYCPSRCSRGATKGAGTGSRQSAHDGKQRSASTEEKGKCGIEVTDIRWMCSCCAVVLCNEFLFALQQRHVCIRMDTDFHNGMFAYNRFSALAAQDTKCPSSATL